MLLLLGALVIASIDAIEVVVAGADDVGLVLMRLALLVEGAHVEGVGRRRLRLVQFPEAVVVAVELLDLPLQLLHLLQVPLLLLLQQVLLELVQLLLAAHPALQLGQHLLVLFDDSPQLLLLLPY